MNWEKISNVRDYVLSSTYHKKHVLIKHEVKLHNKIKRYHQKRSNKLQIAINTNSKHAFILSLKLQVQELDE